jgi:hypothetical protein
MLGLQLGAVRYLRRPLEPEHFLRIVDEALAPPVYERCAPHDSASQQRH